MTQQQCFQAAVGQAVQTRELNQYFGVTPPTEEQLQHEFALRTKIDCGKEARLWLQQLMEHHGFGARELAVSWKANAIYWDKKHGRPRVSTSWLEAAFVYFVAGALGLWCLSLAVAFIWAGPDHLPARMAVYALCLAYLGICWLMARFILWPRRVALRVRAVAVCPTQWRVGACADEPSHQDFIAKP